MYFVFVVTRTDGSAYAIKLHGATKEDAEKRAKADAGKRFHSVDFRGMCDDTEDRGLPLYDKACVKADKICAEQKPKEPEQKAEPSKPEQRADPKTGALF